MKKEIKSYEELSKCHLKPFEAEFCGSSLKGVIVVSKNGDMVKLYGDAFYREGCKNDWDYALDRKIIQNIIVEVEEQWQPKFGELVEVSNGNEKWYQRVFVGEYAGKTHCIHEKDERFFETDICESYRVLQWDFIRKIEQPKNIEISLEEAKNIIAKEKGIKAEQVNLNFKIN